jgi:hypothetical protein
MINKSPITNSSQVPCIPLQKQSSYRSYQAENAKLSVSFKLVACRLMDIKKVYEVNPRRSKVSSTAFGFSYSLGQSFVERKISSHLILFLVSIPSSL